MVGRSDQAGSSAGEVAHDVADTAHQGNGTDGRALPGWEDHPPMPLKWVPLPGGAWIAVDPIAWALAKNAHPLDDELTPRRSLAIYATAPSARYQAQPGQVPDVLRELTSPILQPTQEVKPCS